MKYGDYVNTDMNVNVDGLPNDDSTMKDELVGRLQTALASAQK